MTSSTTKIDAVNGATTTDTDLEPVHGLAVLRRLEAQGLIRVITDALYETSSVTRLISEGIRATPGEQVPTAHVQRWLLDALACVETVDHYLRMLDGVIDNGQALSEEPIPFR